MNEPTDRQLRLKDAILELARSRKVSAWSMLGRPKRLLKRMRSINEETRLAKRYSRQVGEKMANVRRAWKRYGILPSSYFRFRLFEPDRAPLVPLFLDYDEVSELLEHIHGGRGPRVARDKFAFAEACAAARIPCIPTVAYFEKGKMVQGNSLPPEDLFVKYTDETSGLGAKLWKYDGAYSADGQSFTSEQLLDHLRDASVDQPHILQPRVTNHPEMAKLSNGALCTMRIVTGKLQNRIEVFFGILRMPTGSSFVDNFTLGGIAAPIDLEMGRLGPAAQKALLIPPLTHHPDTKEPIDGTVLACWHDAKALCIKAHETAFAEVPTLGWDVAWTTRGPMLVETNPIWGIGLVQMAHDQPALTNERFVSFLEENLKL